ncbi:MAG: SH3 domain-containing protein [Chloroflexi bacterium]|nr:SH3 domain-containing protein [Chloroflexota bacterium]
MKRLLLLLALTLILILGAAVPVLAQTAYGTGTVNTGNLNVRSGPGVSFSILTSLGRGTVVSLLGRNNAATWVQVLTATRVIGWVNASYLVMSVGISSLPITDGTAATATMTGAFVLNVRSGPGTSFSVLATIDRGAVVTLVGRSNAATWAQIRTASGVTGWVNASYLTPSVTIASLPVTDGTVTNPPPATGGPRIHIVQPGENLFRISLIYNVSMYAIAQANNLLNLNQIYAGQRLIIP